MMRQHRKSWTFMGADILFLTTVGRRSGQERATALAWFPDGDGDGDGDGAWLVVASAAGAARSPDWYLNLAAHPDQARIELGAETIPVRAEQVTGEDRAQAWARIVAAQPRYAKYQQKTDRELPVIRLVSRMN
jgi:deazaflavin-dependent oxidoreductase (nitroreductase family)